MNNLKFWLFHFIRMPHMQQKQPLKIVDEPHEHLVTASHTTPIGICVT